MRSQSSPTAGVRDHTWARWEAERRRSVAKARAGRPADLAELVAKLGAAGLRPIVDHELSLVRGDCPACRASSEDGIWRCLVAVPRRGRSSSCDACGIERVHDG